MMKQDGVQRRDRRGVILIAVTGMIFVLLAFVGLAFDVGYMQWSRRRAQTAADAAALSGAWAVQLGSPVTTAGKSASAVNGFTDATDNVTVTIRNPPSSGSYMGNSSAVEAMVSQDPPSYFMRVLGYDTLPVRARAVAIQGFGTACVYALNPSVGSALKFSGNVTVNLGCGVIDDSGAGAATKVAGNTVINMSNGASIGTVGAIASTAALSSILPPASQAASSPSRTRC